MRAKVDEGIGYHRLDLKRAFLFRLGLLSFHFEADKELAVLLL